MLRHGHVRTGRGPAPAGPIRRFVRTARRYRTVQIRAGQHMLTAEDRIPEDLREVLALIAHPDLRTN